MSGHPEWETLTLDNWIAMRTERDTLHAALEMLWTHYLLPITDEQKEQVRAALAGEPQR